MKRLLGYFDSVGKIAAAVAAVIAAISGAVALYYVLRPPPPAEGKANFGGPLTQRGPLTLEAFLRAYDQPLEHYSPKKLALTGLSYTVTVTRKGLRDVETPIVWHLLRSPDSVPVEGFEQQIPFAAAPRNDFTCVVHLFIPLPQLKGQYYAVILINQGSFTLDEVETKVFTGYSGARPANPPQTTTVSTTPEPPPRTNPATTGNTNTAPATTGTTPATTPSETTETVLVTPVTPVAPPVVTTGTPTSP